MPAREKFSGDVRSCERRKAANKQKEEIRATAMKEQKKNFWDKNAGRYDRFMRKDRAAYDEMYELIRPIVRHKTVLELATGTGLITKAHRERGGTHRGDGCLCGDDCRSEAG